MLDLTGRVDEFELKPKERVAGDLVDWVAKMMGYA
jgi:hypothetical protein